MKFSLAVHGLVLQSKKKRESEDGWDLTNFSALFTIRLDLV